MEASVKKKAELIETGGVVIDPTFRPYVSRATAGPGAGLESIFVNIDGHRVRLGVRQASRFRASLAGDEVTIYDEEKKTEFVKGKLEEAISHCPKQAYITVSERCVFDCKFCPVPRLQGKIKSTEEVLGIVRRGLENPALASISMTSGVWKTPEEEVDRIAKLVQKVSSLAGNIPIGVSVYPTDDSSEIIKKAGATEIKYNIETADPAIFGKVCPDLSQEYIIKSLEHAVSVFGRNHVFSNILIGLGESDETVVKGIEMLASKGVIPILRKVNPHPLRKDDVYVEKVSASRLLKLASEERHILEKYGLDVKQAVTGCLPCTGCDVSPVRDL